MAIRHQQLRFSPPPNLPDTAELVAGHQRGGINNGPTIPSVVRLSLHYISPPRSIHPSRGRKYYEAAPRLEFDKLSQVPAERFTIDY